MKIVFICTLVAGLFAAAGWVLRGVRDASLSSPPVPGFAVEALPNDVQSPAPNPILTAYQTSSSWMAPNLEATSSNLHLNGALGESMEQAADRASNLATLDGRRDSWRQVISAWVRTDVDAALRWALAHPDEEPYSLLMAEWVTVAPAAAADQWLRKPPRYTSWCGMDTVIESWVRNDAQAAEHWIDANLTGPLRWQADTAFVHTVAPIEIQAALRRFDSLDRGHRRRLLTVSNGMPSRIRVNAPGHFLRTWAEADPAAALKWARSLESPEEQKLAVSVVERKPLWE